LSRTTSASRTGTRRAGLPSRWRSRPWLQLLEGRTLPSTVTNLSDAGAGSLRQAILDTPPGGMVDFQPGLSGTITLTSGELAINQDLRIAGPGAGVITVSGNDTSRVFDLISAQAAVSLAGLTISHGLAEQGGAVYSAGRLSVSQCVVADSRAVGADGAPGLDGRPAFGGGIYDAAGATLTITQSTFQRNQAVGGNGGAAVSGSGHGGDGGAGAGGAIYVTQGDLAIDASTLTDNQATGGQGGAEVWVSGTGVGGLGSGGGIYLAGGALDITSTIISRNQATGGVGGPGAQGLTYGFQAGAGGPGQGGGISVADSRFDIADSDLSVNQVVGGRGGRAGFSHSGTAGGDGGQASGGALYAADSAITVHMTQVSTNQTTGGAGAAGNPGYFGGGQGGDGGSGSGGGLYVSGGSLEADLSRLSGNRATGGDHGGAPSDSPGAIGQGLGGGIAVTGGALEVMSSAVLANQAADGGDGYSGTAPAAGGGLYNAGAVVDVLDSTVAGNQAPSGSGAGLYNAALGTLTVTWATVSQNAGQGLVVAPTATATSLRNTILAGNGTAGDLNGLIASAGHNLIGDGRGGSGYADSDLVGTAEAPIDPLLGPLQDNGGPTPTMALLPGSPALNAGDPSGAPAWDQRGPGYPRVVDGRIDIGAFEVQPAVAPTITCSVADPVLAPPDRQLVNVGLTVAVMPPEATLQVQVFGNDRATAADAADIGPDTLQLRAARRPLGAGRVYLIVATASDAAGSAVDVCSVVVPRNASPGALALVQGQAALAVGYYRLFHRAPPGYQLLGQGPAASAASDSSVPALAGVAEAVSPPPGLNALASAKGAAVVGPAVATAAGATEGQSAQPQAAEIPIAVAESWGASDAVFAGLGDPVADGLAEDLLSAGW
jgi:hypothetical protein